MTEGRENAASREGARHHLRVPEDDPGASDDDAGLGRDLDDGGLKLQRLFGTVIPDRSSRDGKYGQASGVTDESDHQVRSRLASRPGRHRWPVNK